MKRIFYHTMAILFASVLTSLAFAGCSKCSSRPEIVPQPPPKPLEEALAEEVPHVRLTFLDRKRKPTFAIRINKDRGTMKGADGQVLAHYELWGKGIKVKDTGGKTIAYLAGGTRRVELKKSEITPAHYVFRRRPQGHWALRDGAGQLVYIAKTRGWGILVTTAAGDRAFRVREKDDRTVLQDATGKALYVTRHAVDPRGVAWLGMEQLTLPERGALLVHFQLTPPP